MIINNLSLYFGIQSIFEDVSINIPNNEKIGIVGVNGSGKTTFFKLLMKQITPDSGKITITNNKRIDWLPQVIDEELIEEDELVLDFLLDARPISKLNKKIEDIDKCIEYLKDNKLKITNEVEAIFNENIIPIPQTTISYEQLLRRPEVTIEFIENFIEIPFSDEIKEQVYINLKYEGYIKKAYKEAEKMLKLEEKQIPEDIDYDKVKNIASEARQKLKEVRPTTIAQAIRISGVNPADISILSVYLKKEYANDNK